MPYDVNKDLINFVKLSFASSNQVDARKFVELNKAMIIWLSNKLGSKFIPSLRQLLQDQNHHGSNPEISAKEIEQEVVHLLNSVKKR